MVILDASILLHEKCKHYKNTTIMSLEYEYNIEFELSITINKGVKLILG